MSPRRIAYAHANISQNEAWGCVHGDFAASRRVAARSKNPSWRTLALGLGAFAASLRMPGVRFGCRSS
ncbi:MAG TPA: hypothetical protein VE309_05330 [Caulobacteraceae bacterium]|nr:hypothetical protein [Caulobacteraceae bacterium]